MPATAVFRTAIAPEWVDYNGHLRDAYYMLILSFATDALMDRLGLDAAYRERARCTLYTLEAHIHYLQEVKQTDVAEVCVRILAADAKRIHAGLELHCERHTGPAALAEVMLLHVHQGEKVTAMPFPPAVSDAIGRLHEETAGLPVPEPGSRRMELRPRP
ncbi:MAG: thioesterase [Proteobacteria bacterium]|nr:thioesterase [Pseudomonadota bacterium]